MRHNGWADYTYQPEHIKDHYEALFHSRRSRL
jgi:hypothetical protein